MIVSKWGPLKDWFSYHVKQRQCAVTVMLDHVSECFPVLLLKLFVRHLLPSEINVIIACRIATRSPLTEYQIINWHWWMDGKWVICIPRIVTVPAICMLSVRWNAPYPWLGPIDSTFHVNAGLVFALFPCNVIDTCCSATYACVLQFTQSNTTSHNTAD